MIRFLTGALSMFTVALSLNWFGEYVSVYHGIGIAGFWFCTGVLLTVILLLPKVDDK